MKKSRLVCAGLLALVTVACQQEMPVTEDPAVTNDRPNILWLIAEDLSAIDMATYGNTASQTPNIDQLARDGTLYSSAFTTTPVCAPSRSSLITGMQNTTINAHNHRSHVGPKSPYQTGYTLPRPVKPLPQIFREAGYTTAIWGKTDYNFNWSDAYDFDFQSEVDGQARGWDEVTRQQPFFAQVHFRETHRDWDGNEQVIDRSQIELPPIYPDTPEVREAWGDYLDDLASLDRKVGALLSRLEEEGLAENTVVIFFSDHGREMPRGKQWVYDGGIHVPLIIRRPNEETPGTRDDQLVSNVDISAVSLDLANIEVPGYFDGRSFLDPKTTRRDHIIATRDRDDETFDRVRAVRTDRYKYIRNYYPELPWTQYNHYIEQIKDDGQTHYETFGIMRELHEAGELTDKQALFFAPRKPREELYDVANDPWETENLANDPAMSTVLKDLRAKLDDWIEDPHPQLGWRDKGAVP
ncbi:MAG: sulfatase, partial [Gammaproteobacteria bacterium]|nr:sulfatase [Gammaproteobacteria bacterium]